MHLEAIHKQHYQFWKIFISSLLCVTTLLIAPYAMRYTKADPRVFR
jgi:hypothetical protein